jgi:hypothetical protein
MTTPERYSDKRLKDNFTAYVLLSERIQFRFPEIWEAVREDYPDLAWAFSFEVAPPFDSAPCRWAPISATRPARPAVTTG